MLDSESISGSTHPLHHIFELQSSQTGTSSATGTEGPHIDKSYYTGLTDTLVDHFYPKSCCGERLTVVDGARATILRCQVCHKQQSRFADTPLQHLKVPRWIFSYLLKEAQVKFPQVLTVKK